MEESRADRDGRGRGRLRAEPEEHQGLGEECYTGEENTGAKEYWKTPPARKRLGEGEDGADTLDSSLESSTTRKIRKKFKYPLLTNWRKHHQPLPLTLPYGLLTPSGT